MIAPLVAGLEFPLDAAQPPNGGRRDQQRLAPMREGQRARLGQRNRIPFLIRRGRIGIDLVQKQISRRGRAQPHRRVRPGHDQNAARELLGQHRIARIPRPRRFDPLAQLGAFLDQRINPLARVAFCQFHRRLDRQHRPRRVMHHEADEAVARFGRAHLGGLHEHHPLHRAHGRERIHDLAHIGRARCPVPPGLSRGARAEPAMLVRPLRDRQVRVRPNAPRPLTQQVLCTVEPADIVTQGQF